MNFRKCKRLIIFVSFYLLITLSLISLFCMGGFTNLKYFELNQNNELQIRGEYVDVEGLFSEERYTKEEIEQVEKYSKQLGITPEEFVFVSFLINGNYTLNFDDIEIFSKEIKEYEQLYIKDFSDIYKEFCSKDIFMDSLIRGKLSERKEIKDSDISVNGIYMFKKVEAIAPAGFVGTSFKSIEINDNIKRIGNFAFAFSSTEYIHLGDNTLSIGKDVLSHCDTIKYIYSSRFLDEFSIGDNNELFKDLYLYKD